MTTEATETTQNTTSSATHARWVRLCRIPLLFAFALVAYEAVRLPLAARSTDPDTGRLASATPQDDSMVTDVDPTADNTPDNLPGAIADNPQHFDVTDAVIVHSGTDGDSAELHPADLMRSDGGVEPVDAADDNPWEAQMTLALNTGNQVVGDVVETLAQGASKPVNDKDLFGPQVDDLVDVEVHSPLAVAAATETTPVDTTPTVDVAKPLVLANPSDVEIGYLVDGEVYTLGPGQRHEIGIEQNWAIEFHRGGDFGDATYELSAGTYEFRVGDTGWELRR